MKTLYSFASVILLFALSFSACKKKDDSPSIVGTWTSIMYRDQMFYGTTVLFDTSGAMPTDGIVIEFKSDKTYIGWTDGTIESSGSYIADGHNLILKDKSEIDSFTYTLTKDEFNFINTTIEEADPNSKYTETITYKRK